jgi:dTDP-4-amino-4,6-dideoxygalactose transaminase
MKVFQEPILVTRPYLPSLTRYQEKVAEIWENQWLTNNGPILQRFQRRLADTLALPEGQLSLFVNGTLALEIVYQALGLNTDGAEVITTPFTFVATSHAIRRIGATPVFADVDPDTLCMTPESAEKRITEKTKAIVPVHVYGHPCDLDGFERLAKKYDLRLIYDAAHAFGVTIDGRSIGAYGAAAMFSFHSTKLFHSIEGGLLTFKKPELKATLERLKNFAIRSETECDNIGTNAKMNEFSALMGECCLEVLPELIAHRKAIYETYAEVFDGQDGVRLLPRPETMYGHTIEHNYAYVPVLFKAFATRERVYNRLKECNVFTRRYFYPLLSDFEPYRTTIGATPIARQAADCVLSLPSYHGLDLADVRDVARNILEIVK